MQNQYRFESFVVGLFFASLMLYMYGWMCCFCIQDKEAKVEFLQKAVDTLCKLIASIIRT